eukprot:3061474-Amphidinium_carterae.1
MASFQFQEAAKDSGAQANLLSRGTKPTQRHGTSGKNIFYLISSIGATLISSSNLSTIINNSEPLLRTINIVGDRGCSSIPIQGGRRSHDG